MDRRGFLLSHGRHRGAPLSVLVRDLAPFISEAMKDPEAREPIPMLLWCPECGARHVDRGDFASKPHHTHACQGCGHVWRPAIACTVGVQFLPGFKD